MNVHNFLHTCCFFATMSISPPRRSSITLLYIFFWGKFWGEFRRNFSPKKCRGKFEFSAEKFWKMVSPRNSEENSADNHFPRKKMNEKSAPAQKIHSIYQEFRHFIHSKIWFWNARRYFSGLYKTIGNHNSQGQKALECRRYSFELALKTSKININTTTVYGTVSKPRANWIEAFNLALIIHCSILVCFLFIAPIGEGNLSTKKNAIRYM
jgi:hypothetical protein